MPPGKEMDDLLTIMRSGMWRLYYQLSADGRKRYYNELLPVLHKAKVETMGDRDSECYYLVYLGTKPSGQRRGYGRKLIEQMAAKVRNAPWTTREQEYRKEGEEGTPLRSKWWNSQVTCCLPFLLLDRTRPYLFLGLLCHPSGSHNKTQLCDKPVLLNYFAIG